MSSRRHPRNAEGPFYVVLDDCMLCEAPVAEAPDLMAWDHGGPSGHAHCFFERQPDTPEELDRAIRAIRVSCCGAVRYGGADAAVLERIARHDPGACDALAERKGTV